MKKDILYLIMTIIGAVLLLGTTVFVLMNWAQMPEQIPLHYNFAGEVTGYGGKAAIIPVLVIAWVIFVLMTVLVKFPKTWNIPVTVTKENFERVYSITRAMMEVTKLEAVLLMMVTIISSAKGISLPWILMVILMVVILLTVLTGIYKLYKNK